MQEILGSSREDPEKIVGTQRIYQRLLYMSGRCQEERRPKDGNNVCVASGTHRQVKHQPSEQKGA